MADTGRLLEVLAALASRPRMEIVEAFASSSPRHGDSFAVSEIAEATEMSRFAVSRHLDVLRRAGVLVGSKDGHRHLHRLDPAALEVIEDWLYPILEVAEAQRMEPLASRG